MSTLGRFLRVTSFGESHSHAVGVVIDGLPRMTRLCEREVQQQLDRRRPGQSKLTTARDEKDRVVFLSGIEKGVTLGSPLAMLVCNEDQRPKDYAAFADVPRPSHADFTYQLKYGVRASSGGGRSSARETIARVAAGAVADKWLRDRFGTSIVAWVSAVGDVQAPAALAERVPAVSRDDVDGKGGGVGVGVGGCGGVRCPDAETARRMAQRIREAADAHDSVGGVITCVCSGVPPGLGEPVFDKVSASITWRS